MPNGADAFLNLGHYFCIWRVENGLQEPEESKDTVKWPLGRIGCFLNGLNPWIIGFTAVVSFPQLQLTLKWPFWDTNRRPPVPRTGPLALYFQWKLGRTFLAEHVPFV
jgi:hypothetical protein